MKKVAAVITAVALTFGLSGCGVITDDEACTIFAKDFRKYLGATVAGDDGLPQFQLALQDLESKTEGDLQGFIKDDIAAIKNGEPFVSTVTFCGINAVTGE